MNKTPKIKNEGPVGTYYDSWMRITCSNDECKAMNWIELGDLNDYSARDRHACICHACGTLFWLDWHTKHYAEDHFEFSHMDPDKDVLFQDDVYAIEGQAEAP